MPSVLQDGTARNRFSQAAGSSIAPEGPSSAPFSVELQEKKESQINLSYKLYHLLCSE